MENGEKVEILLNFGRIFYLGKHGVGFFLYIIYPCDNLDFLGDNHPGDAAREPTSDPG